jgi:protein SCO1
LNRKSAILGLLLLLLAAGAVPRAAAQASADGALPREVDGIDDIKQNLGALMPLGLKFRDDAGRDVTLGDYFKDGKPVLITFNYFGCPSLCGLQLEGLLEALKQMKWTPGDQFRILTVSFEPLEGPDLAEKKKATFINELGRSAAAGGWHFLTGPPDSIRGILDNVGMTVRWNEQRQEWAHASVMVAVSPKGKIVRYFGGVYFDPGVLRLSLVEASEGKVGSIWDQVFLICFHYVNTEGKYAIAARRVMAIGGGVFVLLLGGVLLGFWRAERRRGRVENRTAFPPPGVAHGVGTN